ncbi:Mannosyltransferase 1 CMT1 protein [Rutstroemia sp. NJR-2017a BBW]|nr:Mannosyltransferase 1 CMT1 protein [Rutstroemia sp. NJR-2017a BBW]
MSPRSSPRYQPVPDSEDPSTEFKDKPLSPRRLPLSLYLRKIRRVCRPAYIFLFLVLFLVWQITFNASYTNPPPFSVPTDEKVFIATNIVNKDLIDGVWGDRLVDLVNTIGRDRVFVSIYGGPKDALTRLESRLQGVQKSIIAEADDPIDLESLHRITLPSGQKRIKRIEYLADLRNRAMAPMTKGLLPERYDRVLFVNDVWFDVEGALRLLWGTMVNEQGKAEYKAVCAADFVASWKYYDTYGTRDAEGYSIGVPIFPWFGSEGEARSRNDVLEGRDAVRVKSCWGGMVAFDETKLEPQGGVQGLPVRFRSEPENFWDASECCLVHADVIAAEGVVSGGGWGEDWGEGVFMNPFVRVAYDAGTWAGLGRVKRVERLFAGVQWVVNWAAGMPVFNDRRGEREGEVVRDRLWVRKGAGEEEINKREYIQGTSTGNQRKPKEYWLKEGFYVDYERVARRGGYCGVRQLTILREGKSGGEGEGKIEMGWENLMGEVPVREGS